MSRPSSAHRPRRRRSRVDRTVGARRLAAHDFKNEGVGHVGATRHHGGRRARIRMAIDIHRHAGGSARFVSRLRDAARPQTPVRPRPDHCPVPFLWKVLDDHGKRCIVMDAFLTCPLKNFSGIQIVDWGTWTAFWDQTILPESVKSEMLARFGAYASENHSKVGMTPPPDPAGFRDRLLKSVETKTGRSSGSPRHSSGISSWPYSASATRRVITSGITRTPLTLRTHATRMRGCARHCATCMWPSTARSARWFASRTTERPCSWYPAMAWGRTTAARTFCSTMLQHMRLFNDPGAATTGTKAKRDALSTLRGLVPE